MNLTIYILILMASTDCTDASAAASATPLAFANLPTDVLQMIDAQLGRPAAMRTLSRGIRDKLQPFTDKRYASMSAAHICHELRNYTDRHEVMEPILNHLLSTIAVDERRLLMREFLYEPENYLLPETASNMASTAIMYAVFCDEFDERRAFKAALIHYTGRVAHELFWWYDKDLEVRAAFLTEIEDFLINSDTASELEWRLFWLTMEICMRPGMINWARIINAIIQRPRFLTTLLSCVRKHDLGFGMICSVVDNMRPLNVGIARSLVKHNSADFRQYVYRCLRRKNIAPLRMLRDAGICIKLQYTLKMHGEDVCAEPWTGYWEEVEELVGVDVDLLN